MIKVAALFTIAVALSSAAAAQTDRVAVIRALADEDRQVATIGYRLATANADLCVERMVESGLLIGELGQYDAPYRDAARAVLHLTDRPTVTVVVSGSPADRAGILPGDVLLAADGAPFATIPADGASGRFGGVEAAMGRLDAALADGGAMLALRRAGEDRSVDVVGITACKARFQLLAGGPADATANGTWVQLSTRMATLAETPDELAAILAHELAHNALGHRRDRNPAVQRDHELQADRLMPYLMQRAGYDPHAAVTLYDRLRRKRLGGLIPSATHPGWARRVQAVVAEVARIDAMVASHETIKPPADLIAVRPPPTRA